MSVIQRSLVLATLATLAVLHKVQANLHCYTCAFDGACPPKDSTGSTKECPKNTKYCIVEASLKATANHLPSSTVRTPTRQGASQYPKLYPTLEGLGPSSTSPGASSTSPGASSSSKSVYYTRRCGDVGLEKPADWTEDTSKKEKNGLYCMDESNWKKICYCQDDDCNKHNPSDPTMNRFTTSNPKGDAASSAAKLGMVFAVGILAYVL